MIKKQLKEDLKKVIQNLEYKSDDIVLSISENQAFGDYSSNIALQLSKLKLETGKHNPVEIANKIVARVKSQESSKSYLEKVEVAGAGFLNFFIRPEFIAKDLEEVLGYGDDFGKSEKGKGQKVQVEFISANPTGPLTLANGRGGSLGDTLANILNYLGFEVDREYYVNDTGNQVRLLGESVLAAAGKLVKEDNHYQGEYIQELAKKFADQLNLEPQELGHLLADHLLKEEIQPAISRLGIKFEEFYSERSLYKRNLVEKTAKILQEKGLAYEKDGALWFKSTLFGDEKDRVLITSDNERGKKEPTYFMADVAHHLDVLERGYDKRINFLGADHHGYAQRIKGAVSALGYEGKIDLIFFQLVKLFKEGKEVKMSKRAGNFVTLDELLDQVSKDVIRFFFLMYAPDSHIDFNLDLAKEKSQKNPVFYVQYAHARMSNILKKAEENQAQTVIKWELLNHPTELALVKHLTYFPELVEEIGSNYQVQKLTTYSILLADLFHRFYESSRVLNAESRELKEVRLVLVKAGKIVLGNALKLMGIEAPERM